ncbi:MAG: sialate O-acetylesterase [bacterium]|nr:sialate O-acetylesterase [bacterium]
MELAVRAASGLLVLSLVLSWAHSAWTDGLHKPERDKKIRVFLLAGQSNMEGRADGNKLTPQDRERLEKARDRVQLAFNHEPVGPLNVVAPHPEIAEIYQRDLIFGPELFFGITLSEAWPEEEILLIKLAAGATSLHGSWNPDWREDKATIMHEEGEPKLYGALTAYAKQVLSGCDDHEYEICAMLWVQGETDTKNRTAAAAYGDNLRNLVESIRHDVGDESLPFLLFQVGRGEVVEGMKRTAQEVPNVTLIPQSPDPVSPDFYQKMENGHYNYEGMKKLGRRFAEAFLGQHNQDQQ